MGGEIPLSTHLLANGFAAFLPLLMLKLAEQDKGGLGWFRQLLGW